MANEHLYIEESGNPHGQPLVLLHGWGLSSRVWQDWLPSLSNDYRIYMIDLPGLGRSQVPTEQSYDLDRVVITIAEQLAPRLEGAAIWLGWSLGGVIAAAVAQRYPALASGLVTVATNPCFVARPDWPEAMPLHTFESFSDSLQQNATKTLNRFAMLQGQGDPQARTLLKTLKSVISVESEQPQRLAESLALLADDYRPLFSVLVLPCLHLLAEQDALVPVAVAQQPFWQANTQVLSDCGHVPFLTQPEQLNAALSQFCAAVASAEAG